MYLFYLSPLFFLGYLAKGLSMLWLFKQSSPSLIGFCFPVLYYVYSCSNVYDFFPSNNSGFRFFLLFLLPCGVLLVYLSEISGTHYISVLEVILATT